MRTLLVPDVINNFNIQLLTLVRTLQEYNILYCFALKITRHGLSYLSAYHTESMRNICHYKYFLVIYAVA
jgi:hypothetical protein